LFTAAPRTDGWHSTFHARNVLALAPEPQGAEVLRFERCFNRQRLLPLKLITLMVTLNTRRLAIEIAGITAWKIGKYGSTQLINTHTNLPHLNLTVRLAANCTKPTS
jgi:hypothetical protein